MQHALTNPSADLWLLVGGGCWMVVGGAANGKLMQNRMYLNDKLSRLCLCNTGNMAKSNNKLRIKRLRAKVPFYAIFMGVRHINNKLYRCSFARVRETDSEK